MSLIKNMDFDGFGDCNISYKPVTECPYCNHLIQPVEVTFDNYRVSNDEFFFVLVCSCLLCKNPYLCVYPIRFDEYENEVYCLEPQVFPKKVATRIFDDRINAISPMFVQIYAEAYQAELDGSFKICGMGYRKAVEFLIKDYLVNKVDDEQEKEKIIKMELGNCIANKLENENLKKVAQRCAWLGNDHSHYYVKHPDSDLNTLKKLIDVTVSWILLEMDTEEALKIERR